MTDDNEMKHLLPNSIRNTDYEAYSRNRIDYKLANLLAGDHPIEGNHEVKVIQLAELEILYDATIAAGWQRHTGDWDWSVFVTTTEGELPGESYDIRIQRPEDKPGDDFTACVDYDKVTHVVLDGYHIWDNDDGTNVDIPPIPIDSITNVRWEN